MNCVLRTQTSKTPLLGFIVPLAKALMASESSTLCINVVEELQNPSRTSRSLLNIGDQLPLTIKIYDGGAVNVHNKRRNRTLN
ncbi:hypothetical protein TNCT_570361 [Trichonephila clavata]|uniref:Uncharacterized protein n=1 Tax=Trichonephila clavata TaxID=2740835 RepID=A0A8X6LA64_TRICU|nr:hypothetical protein TNCT_570361 [Trichonephila clavata]